MEDEYVDIVDMEDNVIGKAEIKDAIHANKRYRAAKVLVFDDKNNLIIQKRSENMMNLPCIWDIGIGETLKAGESYREGAIRGLLEEYGIKSDNVNHEFNLIYSDGYKRNYGVFSIKTDQEVKIQQEEISEIRKIPLEEIEKIMKELDFVPSSKVTMERYKQK